MARLRGGSLFTGTGALDLAVMDVFDAEMVWHSQYEPPDKNGKEDTNQYAAKILARHWPDVPNLGDITKVDWQAVLDEHGPIDILTGGFPCQDVSTAGKRAGLNSDSRSGLWSHMARAIHELRPRLVVIENVEGLLSAEADRGLESGAEIVDEDAGAGGVLRALGAVLGDLATLGFYAEWVRVAASEVGAPHARKRVFVYAWPADEDAHIESRDEWGFSASGEAEGGGARSDAGGRGGALAADADGRGCEGHQERDGRPQGGQPQGERRLDAVGCGVRRAAVESSVADSDSAAGRRDISRGRPGEVQGPEVAERQEEQPGRLHSGDRDEGAVAVPAERLGGVAADADGFGRRADVLQLRPGKPDLDWGDYEPAVRRWECILGRPAPWPTDALGRLSAVFTEWMMGLPDGWVTCTPGLTKAAMLRALGNGVVRLQAVAALVLLHDRAMADGRRDALTRAA